ncbi:MAG: 16S rRNA (guanine(966)-N(2))-methyltransferase RsmD [Chthoniobacterales bacterium]
MRVIAGSAAGLILKDPPQGVRPTMDRVKEAIFSSLGDCVPNALVLDLFSGSGALGIEALSRGAESVEFVEHAHETTLSIRRNLGITKLEAKIHEMDVFKFLALYAEKKRYSLIFADPPYDKKPEAASVTERLVKDPLLPALLTENGIFVLEKNARVACEIPAQWSELRRKRYGDTEVVYLSRG